MNAQLAPNTDHPQHASALLRTLVITDLCNSTALVERLGDQAAAELLRSHDRMLRRLLRLHRGQEIDKTDGFLSLFERPIQAVAFGLDYQRCLNEFGVEHGVELKSRIGIHVGEVMSWHNEADDIAKGAKPLEIEGLAKPVAARLMGLAQPGQILLSGVAYTLAHRAEGELGATLSRLKWMHHGRFRFKGVADAVPVYEIGEPGIAPFKSPAWSGKAHRELPLWRRPISLALETLAVLAVVAFPAWQLLKPAPAIAFAERDWVVLGDLRNLTGDSRFDDSLEQAFRIGLEQSRHVIVLSDLQVRDTLRRMQKPPDSRVDRETGVEVAIREGSSALILPTLAEIGGRLRFTAEVVDPATQATVYSHFADGRGAASVLTLLDEVNRGLRESLGEPAALASSSNHPLEKVATANLDALRAYSRAVVLADQNQIKDALALFESALALDPEFARAHLDLARRLMDVGEGRRALDHLERAVKLPERLTEREAMHARALVSSLAETEEQALEAWRRLALQFPDYFPGSGGYALTAWTLANDYANALDTVKLNVVKQNPRRGNGLYLEGALLLGSNQAEAALESFNRSIEEGASFENRLLAHAHLAAGNVDKARQALKLGVYSGTASSRGSIALAQAAIHSSAGSPSAAIRELEGVATSAPVQSSFAEVPMLLATLSLVPISTLHTDGEKIPPVDAIVDRIWSRIDGDTGSESDHQKAIAWLSLAWCLAMVQDDSRAQEALERGQHLLAGARGGLEITQRRAIAEGWLLLNSGDPAAAATRVEMVLDGSELVAARVLALQARLAASQPIEAAQHAAWLIANVGRALAEPQGHSAFQPYNVAWARLSLLTLAEIRADQGSFMAARQLLDQFNAQWKIESRSETLRDRVRQLESKLAE